jgi:hypothetical protein
MKEERVEGNPGPKVNGRWSMVDSRRPEIEYRPPTIDY